MAKPLPKTKTAETVTVQIEMLKRGLTKESLAKSCGVKPYTFSARMAANFNRARFRFVLENALKMPIWSSPAEFAERQQMISSFGFDPFCLQTKELQRQAARLGLRAYNGLANCKKSKLIGFLRRKLTTTTKQNR